MGLGKEIIAGLKSILYAEPEVCFLCGERGEVLCAQCAEQYFPSNWGRCHGCGKLITEGQNYCLDCSAGRGPRHLTKVSAWGYYGGAWREFILDVKYKAQPYKLEKIARPFADWAINELPPADALIPVPLSSERLAERGYNQAEVLASLLKYQLGMPVWNALERRFDTPSQVKLSRAERLQNLTGAFACSPAYDLVQKRVWLVDDVITTGATMEACAQALLQGGVKEIYGLSLAAGAEKKLVTSNN